MVKLFLDEYFPYLKYFQKTTLGQELLCVINIFLCVITLYSLLRAKNLFLQSDRQYDDLDDLLQATCKTVQNFE